MFNSVERAFNTAECLFNTAECPFNTVEHNFFLLPTTFSSSFVAFFF